MTAETQRTHLRRLLSRAFVFGCIGGFAMASPASAQVTSSSVIEQTGFDNQTTIVQDGEGNRAEVSVLGNSNEGGEIRQSGNGSVTELSVVGDGNSFSVTQSGEGGNNLAIGDVRGDSNALFIDQINPLSDAYRNYASVTQDGAGNIASVGQTVAAFGDPGTNSATLEQYGSGNDGTISQSGSSNVASLIQDGDNLVGAITQDGAGHNVELTQTGEGLDALSITQSNCALAGGCPALRVEQTAGATIFGGAAAPDGVVTPGGTAVVTQGGTIIVGGGAGS
ncbi:MAG: hypothetical protein AAF683_03220 [Pseudomonadota bacterium]